MRTSTASLSTPKRSWISITPRVACLQIRHGTIWRFSKIATPSSTSPLKSRWPPPPSIAMVHRLPLMESPLLVSPTLLQRLDLLVLTGLDPHIASVAVLNATSSESLLATPLPTVADPVPGNLIFLGNWTSPASPLRLTILRCRDDLPPGGHRRLGGPLRVASQRTPSPTQRRVASKGSPPPKRVAGDPGVGSTSAKRPLSRGSQSPRRSSREFFSPKRGSPSPKRRRYEARDSVSPPPLHSSRASSREPSQERPHSRSSPRPASPSREEKEADEAPIPATVKAMVEFIKTNLAVQLGLQAFEHLIVGMSVALFCDNTTTVAYLRRSGGTFSSALNSTAREVLLWAESRRIRLLPQFIMGSSNVTADALSRPNQVIGSEWTLHHEVVDQLVHRWPAKIDLFATSLTARLPVYFSPASDPRAAGTDALLQPWDDLQAYAFPLIAIIRRVLLKLRSSRNCELTLIAPFLPQRDWFPDLLELLSDVPITLSDRRDLLRQPHFHWFHQNLPILRLTAWRLSSGSPSKPVSLLRWLDNLSSAEDCPRA